MLAHFAGLLHGLAVHTSIKKLILITLFKCLFMAAPDFHALPCLMLIKSIHKPELFCWNVAPCATFLQNSQNCARPVNFCPVYFSTTDLEILVEVVEQIA